MELLKKVLNKATDVAEELIFVVIVGLICAIPLMLAWNLVVPAVFGLTSINLLQAALLSVLCRAAIHPFGEGQNRSHR